MRQRPLCIVFLVMITVIILLKCSGSDIFSDPDYNNESFLKMCSGEQIRIFGTVISRNEKDESTSYILSDVCMTKGSDRSGNSNNLKKLNLYLSKNDIKIKYGSRIKADGKLYRYENASNPGGFNALEYYSAKGIYYYFYADNINIEEEGRAFLPEVISDTKAELKRKTQMIFPDEKGEIMSALLFGEKADMSSSIKNDFSRLGLSHVLCISGMHIGIIGMAVYKMLMKLRMRRVAACISSSAIVMLYCLFTGAADASMRAGVMFVILLGSKALLKSYDPLNSLCAAGIIILCRSPLSLFAAGFQMSFTAAATVTLIYPKIRISVYKSNSLFNRFVRTIANSAIMWVTVNIFLFPLIVYHFYEFPVMAFISNILILPLIPVLILSGFAALAVCFIFPAAAIYAAVLPNLIMELILFISDKVRNSYMSVLVLGRPQMFQIILAVICLIVLAVLLLKKNRLCIVSAALMIILCTVRIRPEMCITALDVGQGECNVLEAKEGNFIIDAGSSSRKKAAQYCVAPYLKYKGISTIEAVFLSHDDLDHINGIIELLELMQQKEVNLKIKKMILPYWLKDTENFNVLKQLAEKNGVKILFMKKGDVIKAGEMSIEALSPGKDDSLVENEGSLVLKVEYKNFTALFPGDIEKAGEEELLEKLEEYDYLKSPHHGSKYSNTEEMIAAVKPKICVVSAPEDSIYGHPHQETLELLEKYGCSWYQTGLKGAVTVYINNGKAELVLQKV